jgi:hypothetical protein
MWLLVAFLLTTPAPGQPATIIVGLQPTQALCEQFKREALAAAIRQYDLTYPLNFRLECRKELP